MPSGPTLNPFVAPPVAAQLDEVSGELAASLRHWEAALVEREHHWQEAAARLAERERELAEEAALMQAKAQLQAVARATPQRRAGPVLTREAYDALEKTACVAPGHAAC